jgi:hypothetical protein
VQAITLVISDSVTGTLPSGVRLSVTQPDGTTLVDSGATVDARGIAIGVDSGTYKLLVTAVGYRPWNKSVNVPFDQCHGVATVNVSARLQRE